MKKISIIIFLSLFLIVMTFSPVYAKAVASIYLIDMSSSVSACDDNVMLKNMRVLREDVRSLNKNDRVIAIAFGWRGKPFIIIDANLPAKRGGGGRLLADKKSEILKAISTFLKGSKKELDDSSTDIDGALKEFAVIRADLNDSYDVRLIMLSDGQQTSGINFRRTKNMSQVNEYVSALQKYLQTKRIEGLKAVDIIWYGDSCNMKIMTHSDFANFQLGIKKAWVNYLTANGVRSIEYRILYR